jgi:hypothetical protein
MAILLDFLKQRLAGPSDARADRTVIEAEHKR